MWQFDDTLEEVLRFLINLLIVVMNLNNIEN